MHLGSIRIWWVWLAIIGLFVGCPSKQESASKKPTEDESQRPAIRVLLVGSEELAEGMKRRWQGTSQQPINIKTLSEESLLAEKGLKADIVIYPARLLGEMVERKWLNPLPAKMVEKCSKGPESELTWPIPWQGQATYGKRLWGVPMGMSIPVVVRQTPSVETKGIWPLAELQAIALKSPDQGSNSSDANPKESASVDPNAMIDRFLLILASQSTISANTGAFFQLRDLKPRLLEPAFIAAAKEFSKCGANSPTVWTGSHETAWSAVQRGKAAWSIGIPNLTPPAADAVSLSAGKLESGSQGRSGTLLVDSGSGLIASVSITTFQSAVSNFFLEWLDQNDQREALSRDTTSIQPRSIGQGVAAANRPDLASYQRLRSQLMAQGLLLHELRFRGGYRYRQKLGETLVKILENPEKIEELLAQCRQEWETISEELDRDAQQRSLERSLQLLEADAL